MIEQFKKIKRIRVSLDIVTELMSNVTIVHTPSSCNSTRNAVAFLVSSTRIYLELSSLCSKSLCNTSASQIEAYFSFGVRRW